MNQQPLPQQVVVRDVQMPFGSMVVFMVKWAIAAIPALVILIVLGVVVAALATGVVASLGSGRSRPASSVTQLQPAPLTSPTASSSPESASAKPTSTDPARVAYREKVLVRKVEVGKSVLGEPGVFGEVKNAGDRTLKEVEITIYCLGADGKPVFEKAYRPVRVSDLGIGDAGQALKPGYGRPFGVKLDDAPSDWTKKVDVKVTNVEFQ